jgi:hypothetical protein
VSVIYAVACSQNADPGLTIARVEYYNGGLFIGQ